MPLAGLGGGPPHDQEEAAAVAVAALAAIPVGVTITAPDGRCVFANAMAAQLGGAAEPGSPAVECHPDGRIVEATALTVAVRGQDYVVRTARDVTEQRKLEEGLFRQAYFDDLTGLPNRSLIERTVAGLIEDGGETCFALAFLDVDDFKQINDFYGHAAGDDLLVKIARRISDELRGSDLVARVGGDEFLMLVSPIEQPEDVARIFERLLRRLNSPYFIDGQEVISSTSIGVSLFPDHGTDYKTLCANADTAMYRLKSTRKGGIRLFEHAIGQAASERLALEQRLRLAIRDRRLCCVYQPKVDFRSLDVVGVEVLLRWRDEQGIIQPPGAFLQLATELGLMDEITHIVLDETVDAIDLINVAFGHAASVSINIAAKQAADVVFMTSIARAMSDTGFGNRFMVELTEEAFLAKSVFQTHVLPLLRQHGIRVSIDDFGIGYSSLSALADITADEIKVDRSFITNIHERPRSQIILKAIESLGQALGMDVLVEGVETIEELTYLQSTTQIRHAQGYYFARPMFLEDLPRARAVHERLTARARSPELNRLSTTRGRTVR